MAAVTQVRILVSAVSHTVVAEVLSFSTLHIFSQQILLQKEMSHIVFVTSEAEVS